MTQRILHLIGGLERGGAETMLYKLVSAMDRNKFTCEVVSLTTLGPLGQQIQAEGIAIQALGMHQNKPKALLKLMKILLTHRPQLIQSWNHHSDFLALTLGRLCGIRRIFWNIRCSQVLEMGFPWLVKILSYLSRFPTGIIVNSKAGQKVHQGLGYHPKIWHLIGNGFDTDRFVPSLEKRQAFRLAHHIDDEIVLVGLIARFDPMKDHATFFQAASQLIRANEIRFVLAGQGMHWQNTTLIDLIPEKIRPFVILCGEDNPVDGIDAALDICVLCSSRTEGFPNAIGEAMSCGIPCVVTDVGDCATLVGDTGIVIPTQSPQALTQAIQQLIDEGPIARQERGVRARHKILSTYSLAKITARYEKIYTTL